MNRSYIQVTILSVLLISLLSSSMVNGQTSHTRVWSEGSAYILPQKRVELGLFQPLRYGQSERFEWSTHPIYFFIIPNFNLKWFHGLYNDFAVATRYSAYYPTLLLRTIAREGTGGIISPEFDIPHMIGFTGEVLISKPIQNSLYATFKLGIATGIKFGGLDERTTIDIPLVYNRLAVFYHG